MKKNRPSKRQREAYNRLTNRNPVVTYSGKDINRGMTPPSAIIRETLIFTSSIVSDSGGLISARFSLRNPLAALNGSGTYVGAAEFGGLFDCYRPLTLLVQLAPIVPRGTTAFGALITAADFDNINAAPNFSNVYEFDNRRVLDAWKNNSIDVKIPRLSSGQRFDGVGDPIPVTIQQGGWIDFATPPEEGTIFLSGIGFPASTAIYFAMCVMTVELKYKR